MHIPWCLLNQGHCCLYNIGTLTRTTFIVLYLLSLEVVEVSCKCCLLIKKINITSSVCGTYILVLYVILINIMLFMSLSLSFLLTFFQLNHASEILSSDICKNNGTLITLTNNSECFCGGLAHFGKFCEKNCEILRFFMGTTKNQNDPFRRNVWRPIVTRYHLSAQMLG